MKNRKKEWSFQLLEEYDGIVIYFSKGIQLAQWFEVIFFYGDKKRFFRVSKQKLGWFCCQYSFGIRISILFYIFCVTSMHFLNRALRWQNNFSFNSCFLKKKKRTRFCYFSIEQLKTVALHTKGLSTKRPTQFAMIVKLKC